MLRRLGNKKKMAQKIQASFPKHSIYMEPFFGAGGMFFNKPKVRYNYVNDLDSEVFNLFQIVANRKDELIELVSIMPIHEDLWQYWKKNKETDPLKKALRFIMLSNFGYMGQAETLRLGCNNSTKVLINNLKITHEKIKGVQFNNCDFREFFKKFPIGKDVKKAFIYCDPPYLGTEDNYLGNRSETFKEKDSKDLFDVLEGTGIRWAMSEFRNPFIIQQIEKRNLNIISICNRANLKTRSEEILITNYQVNQLSLFNSGANGEK